MVTLEQVKRWVAGWVNSMFWPRASFLSYWSGTAGSHKPIRTNSDGYVDASFYDPSVTGPFVLKDGAAGGQTVYGGTAAAEALILYSTSNATKGTVNIGDTFYVDQTNGRLGLLVASPSYPFDLQANVSTLAAYINQAGTGEGLVVRMPSSQTSFASQVGALVIRNPDTTLNNFARINFAGEDGTAASATIAARFVNHVSRYADLSFWTRAADGFLERMTITSAGLVGIGTSTPSYELDIYEASAVAVARIRSALTTGRGTLLLEGSASQGYFSAFGATATGTLFGQNVADALAIYSVTASRMQIGTFDSAPLYLGTNNTLAMTIDTSQNVIIGGTAVTGSETLKVVGGILSEPSSGNANVQVKGFGGRLYSMFSNTAGTWGVYDATATANRMTIDSAGDVAIVNNLEVNGAITQAGEPVYVANGSMASAASTFARIHTHMEDIGDITSTQALTIDITVGSGGGNMRSFITELYFVGHRASTANIYAISYGTIAWQYNGSGNGIIVVDDTTHRSSGTVASAVTAITDGIRITIDSSAFGNTLDRNSLRLTTLTNAMSPTVSTSIA